MNPLLIASLVGSAVSAGSSAVANASNSKNIARANQLQRDLQRSTMMYNMTEADKARQYDSLGSRVRQLQSVGFNPELAVNMNSSGPSASASTPSVQSPHPSAPLITSADVSNVTNAMNEIANRKYGEELQRAQVLATLSKSNLDEATRNKVNAEIVDIFENMKDRRMEAMDNHLMNGAQMKLIDSQIDDMIKQRDLKEREFKHKQADDKEKNRIQEEIGTLNQDIKTYEYIKKQLQDHPEFLENLKNLDEKALKVLYKNYNTLKLKWEDFKDDVLHGYIGFSWKRGFYYYHKRDGIKYEVGHY